MGYDGFDVDLCVVGELMLLVVVLVVLVFLGLVFRLSGIVYLWGYEIDWFVVLSIEINWLGGICWEIFDGLVIIVMLLWFGIWWVYVDY